MGNVLIAAVALFFAGMGTYALAAPAGVLRLFGVEIRSAEARNEVRAVYGGFGIAVAGLLVVAALDLGGVRLGVLVAVAVSLLGMAAGRLVSSALERPAGLFPTWLFLLVELVLAAALLAAVRL